MTVLRAPKMRGHNPVQVLVVALNSYIRSGQLPPLPTKVSAIGGRVTKKFCRWQKEIGDWFIVQFASQPHSA
jgi:hypothetical protein